MARVSRPFGARNLSILAILIILSFSSWKYFTPSRPSIQRYYLNRWGSHSQPSLEQANDIFDRPPVESGAIKDICAKTEWNSNLVFTCNNSGGGVGNLRNSILNCVRYAIQAGAGMTLPTIIERDPADITHIWDRERVPFDYLFDVPHFVESLELSCPQLRLFNSTMDIPNREKMKDPVTLEPEKIGGPMTPEGLEHPEQWRGHFYIWLAQTTDITLPIIVELGRSYLQYPIYSDPERFALDFGRILKFRTDTRRLSTMVLKNLVKKFELHVDPWAPIWKDSFVGAHLRTERDSQQGWPVEEYEYSRYSTQTPLYLRQAAKSGLKVIYLVSGSESETTQFSADARAMNLTVTTKHDLLTGDDLSELEALSFDQQAMVDFLVLLKSSDFAGVGHSSFAWNVALWRHVFAVQREHLKGPQVMSDELSQVYGSVGQNLEYASCLWP